MEIKKDSLPQHSSIEREKRGAGRPKGSFRKKFPADKKITLSLTEPQLEKLREWAEERDQSVSKSVVEVLVKEGVFK
jgi:hypothetical protein